MSPLTRSKAAVRDPEDRYNSSMARSQQDLHFRLQDLPPELRNGIYRLAVVLPDGIELVGEARKEPSLLRVSRQVRQEAASIYYSENHFSFLIVNMAGPEMVPFRTLPIRYRKHKRGNFTYHLAGGSSWVNLLAWVKAYHENEALACGYSARHATSRDPRKKVAVAACMVVARLRSEPWEKVLSVLEAFHVGIAAANPFWA